MDRDSLVREIDQLESRLAQLKGELAVLDASQPFTPPPFYFAYHALAGFVFGMLGAATSLIFNVVGALMVGKHPLELIRVYLTFPLGDLVFDSRVDHNFALAIGCCLYLGTGSFLGMLFHVVARWIAPRGTWVAYLGVMTGLGLAIWVLNFYVLLSWLQPLLFGGNWIVERIPWWVAALTHLVFGWTIALAEPWSGYETYRPQTEVS